MDVAEQTQTLAQLTVAVEDAKARYDRTKRELNKARRENPQDVGAGHPDGSLLRVIALQRLAFEAYRRALLRFNRFVLDGKLPEPPEDAESLEQ